jgi:DNA-binding NarL/FixJ family response regulator
MEAPQARPDIRKSAAPTLGELPQRIRDIATLRGLGYSFRQIGEQFGVTPQAVSLMLARHRRTMKSLRGAVELAGLSSRAVNVLSRHGVRSRAEAREKFAPEHLEGERNCGEKTLNEIRRWVDGAPFPGM